jgi:hypothetical protein
MLQKKEVLTERKLRGLKSTGKLRFICDGAGLWVLVSATGDRLSFYFRYSLDGRRQGFTFGQWPLISLYEARQGRIAAQRMVAVGENPKENKSKVIAAIRDYRAVREKLNRIKEMEARALSRRAAHIQTGSAFAQANQHLRLYENEWGKL